MAETILGPIARSSEYYRAVVNGCVVPRIVICKESEGWCLYLDGRWALPGRTREELEWWIPILGNAMAVAAGFSHCGPDSGPLNEFRNVAVDIDRLPTQLTLVKGAGPVVPVAAGPTPEERMITARESCKAQHDDAQAKGNATIHNPGDYGCCRFCLFQVIEEARADGRKEMATEESLLGLWQRVAEVARWSVPVTRTYDGRFTALLNRPFSSGPPVVPACTFLGMDDTPREALLALLEKLTVPEEEGGS